jgi:hypothetical protein
MVMDDLPLANYTIGVREVEIEDLKAELAAALQHSPHNYVHKKMYEQVQSELAAAREEIAQLATEGNAKADLLKEYRLDNAKLRALCAARPKGTVKQEEYWRAIQPKEYEWNDAIDAAGRGEGAK